ncbi:MAG: c-type cytochrome [Pseudomonadota bacterium]|nr:c-type cytochrome [Pseudomonadota bacterium]
MTEHDNNSINTMMALLALMVGFAILIGVLAYVITSFTAADADEPMVREAISQRLEPVGQVRTEADGELPTAIEVATAEPASEPQSGSEVYQNACAACHASGVMNSPRLGNKGDWEPRLSQGYEAVVSNAINGIRAMPPRGGNPSLSDEEVEAAVRHMLEASDLAP